MILAFLGLLHFTSATNCNYTRLSNGYSQADCFYGKFENGSFIGNVWCSCKCTRKWTGLQYPCNETKPRRHILACRFGGPRHGYNCWTNTDYEEYKWTSFEEKLNSAIHSFGNVSVHLNTTSKSYCIAGICDRVYPLPNTGLFAGATPTKSSLQDKTTPKPNIVQKKSISSASVCQKLDIEDAHHWAVLGNGNFSCISKDIPDTDLSCSKRIAKSNDFCIHGPSIQCANGHSSFLLGGDYHLAKATTEFTCCKIGCFSSEELYFWLTYQPKCYNCLKPFFDYFWPGCVRKTFVEQEVKLIIFDSTTDIEIGNKKFSCKNHYSFDICCGNNGPSSKDTYTFIDKFCACSSHTNSYNFLTRNVQQLQAQELLTT